MHWLSPAPAGVAGPAGVTCRLARLKSRLKAERIYLPKEPAGAAVRAPSALDVPADWLEAFQSLVNSAYHSVFTFLVRVERIYSDSWLSSSLAARSSGRVPASVSACSADRMPAAACRSKALDTVRVRF